MGNSNSSMRDRIRSYYRPLKVSDKPLATAAEITQAAVQTKLNSLQTSKANMESEYITFLKEYSPYSNVVLKAPRTQEDIVFEDPKPFVSYPAIMTY